MAEIVYILCAVTSTLCAALLIRGYRRNPSQLLLWSSVCFAFLALNNVLLFLDLVVYPNTDLGFWRSLSLVIGFSVLVYGLVWDTV